jgi:hypothetical protein
MSGRGTYFDDDDDLSSPYGGVSVDDGSFPESAWPSDDEAAVDPFGDDFDDEFERPARSAWWRSPWSLAGALLSLLVVASLVLGPNLPRLGGGEPEPTAPRVPPSGLAYCDGVAANDRARIEWATTEMRRVEEGSVLFDAVLDLDLCVGTEDLPYNAGYTSLQSLDGDWTVEKIVLATDVVRRLNPDETAAILVHEATHADRANRGVNCYQTRACTFLPNGIPIEEEVAAHAAEAAFWIALHGPTGTRTGTSWTGGWGAAWENELARAAKEGPDALRDFVIRTRSSSQEGEGIAR